MGNNTNNMNSEEVTRICLAALEELNNENYRFATHPTSVSLALDNALTKHGYPGNLTPKIDNLEHFIQFRLDHDMERGGFHPSVVSAVSRTLAPKPGEMAKILEELLAKFPKLGLALSVASTPVQLIADYQQAMSRVTPYVTAGQMKQEAANEYARVNMIGSMEKSLTSGLSNEIHNKLLGEWVMNHPEISEKVLHDIGLCGVRELQKLFSGPDLGTS